MLLNLFGLFCELADRLLVAAPSLAGQRGRPAVACPRFALRRGLGPVSANQATSKTLIWVLQKEAIVKKRISTLATVLLVGSVAAAYAQKSPVASENSPGDRMKDTPSSMRSGPGASQYAPGHEQKTPGGASELSPGDKMNDTRHHESR